MGTTLVNGKPLVGRPSMEPTERFFAEIAPRGKQFSVNPYVTVYQFQDGVYSMYGYSLSDSPEEYAGPWLELIEGSERAMLIDTGFPIGNIKAVVHELIGDKPLIVANSHCHTDHSGGNSLFERVYCYEMEAPELERAMGKDYRTAKFGRNEPAFCREDLLPPGEYEVVPCKNNTCFDLGGGHEVELIFLPGHTAGGCVFLDKKNRILFSGDAIMGPNQNLGFHSDFYPENLTVTAYHRELSKLATRMDEFDTIFSGHRKLILPKEAVTDVLQACTDILADKDCNEVYEKMMNHLVKIHQVGCIGMTYSDDQI